MSSLETTRAGLLKTLSNIKTNRANAERLLDKFFSQAKDELTIDANLIPAIKTLGGVIHIKNPVLEKLTIPQNFPELKISLDCPNLQILVAKSAGFDGATITLSTNKKDGNHFRAIYRYESTFLSLTDDNKKIIANQPMKMTMQVYAPNIYRCIEIQPEVRHVLDGAEPGTVLPASQYLTDLLKFDSIVRKERRQIPAQLDIQVPALTR